MPSVLPAEYLGLPSTFMYASSRGKLGIPKHIAFIEQFVMTCIRDAIRERCNIYATIEGPIRHGKSFFLDWHTPAWYLGSYPTKRVGLVSHEARFASSWSAKARDSLLEFGASFGVEVDPMNRSRADWSLTKHGGAMQSAGISGGGITGRGYDLFILDDLVKNAADADSEVIRESQWDFLRGTALGRLTPTGVVFVSMARWHEDDLIGRIHREMPGQFRRLRLPALAEPDDPMGRKVDEALWPQEWPAELLAERRAASGEYYFNANYQQRPSPPSGRIFHRGDWGEYGYKQPLESFDRLVWSWDMAFKGNADSDYVVAQAWGRRGADFYLLDQKRERLDYPATKASVQANYLDPRWQSIRRVLIEDKANGSAIIADLRHEVPGLVGVPTPDGKLARAHRVSPYVSSGNVYLPSPELAPWIGAFIDECAAFPAGANDDQVDAFTQAVSDLASYNESSVSVPMGSLPTRLRG